MIEPGPNPRPEPLRLTFEHDPLSKERFDGVSSAVRRLLDIKSEPLTYEEGLEADELRDLPVTLLGTTPLVLGRDRYFSLSENENPHSLEVAQYSPDAIETQSLILTRSERIEGPFIGHIEFDKVVPEARVNGAIYLRQDSQIIAKVDCSAAVDDPLSGYSEVCFDWLDRLGLGSVWTKYLFRSQENGSHLVIVQNLDDAMALRLERYLRNLM